MRLTRLRWLLIAALMSVQAAGAQETRSEAAWRVDAEHWYVLEIGGVKAGWQSVIVQTNGTHWRTTSESEMSISRGAVNVSISSHATIVETSDGSPVSMRSEQNMATQASVTRWEFNDDQVRQVSESNGREIVKTLDYPEKPWVTPVAGQEYWLEQCNSGAETIFMRLLLPENGLTPAEVTYERQDPVEVEYEGATVQATVWKTVSSVMPNVVAIERYAPDGTLIRSEAALPIGVVVTKLSTRQMARSGSGAGPELMLTSFVDLDEPIRNVMRTERASYRLRTMNGDDLELPTAGAQRIERDDRGLMVHVDVEAPEPASDEEIADSAYLEASSAIDCRDELVVKLAARAVRRAGDDALLRAEAMREAANRHVSRKGMATAFASASETARTRRGDCSEHAVLLAAMLRAQEIPARVATGLVYVDHFEGRRAVFGWHMWTQALIDGRWIDLDATLPVPYHAGHILTGVSALSDGSPISELNAVLTLMGNLEIEVIDVAY